MLTLNDGSKIFLSQFTGALHSNGASNGIIVTP